MTLPFCGMILVLITYAHSHAADSSQRRETNPAFRHLLRSEKQLVKEPINASGLGHFKVFVGKIGFNKVLFLLDELRPKESNDLQELLMPAVRRRRDLSSITDDILHSGHYYHMSPSNQVFLTQLKHSADSGTLTSFIGSMGYSFVLKLMENLSPTDAHRLNSAIVKIMRIFHCCTKPWAVQTRSFTLQYADIATQ